MSRKLRAGNAWRVSNPKTTAGASAVTRSRYESSFWLMKVANIIHLSWSPFTPCHVQVSTRLFGPLKTIGANNPTDHFCLGFWGSVILKDTHVWHKNWNDTGDPRSSLWLQMLGYPWLQTCGLSNHQWRELRQNRCENRIRLWYPGYSFPLTSSLCPPLWGVLKGSDEEMMCWTSGRFNVKKTLRNYQSFFANTWFWTCKQSMKLRNIPPKTHRKRSKRVKIKRTETNLSSNLPVFSKASCWSLHALIWNGTASSMIPNPSTFTTWNELKVPSPGLIHC